MYWNIRIAQNKILYLLHCKNYWRENKVLKLDRKELAEHIMLVDLARNDIARVAKPGSRVVTELLIAEKYESVQHLVLLLWLLVILKKL